MISIPLRGKRGRRLAVLVDDEFAYLRSEAIYLDRYGYARLFIAGKLRSIHRIIANAAPGDEVDHKDGDKLNCLRENLRIVSRTLNNRNRPQQANNQSGYKGVSFDKRTGSWKAQLQMHGKGITIGRFSDPKDAAMAYNKTVLKLHGPDAWVNPI